MSNFIDKMCTACDTVMVRTVSLSFVCLGCGREDFSDMFEGHNIVGVCNFAQLQNGYSRVNRFKNYLYSVLGIHFGPSSTAPIWNHLKPCQTMDELVKMVSKTPVKNKHYESLHSYAKVFLVHYEMPETLKLREIEQIQKLFLDIQYAYAQIYGPKTVFFSYPWLLYTILKAMDREDYVCFVKNLKCQKRALGYAKKLHICIDHVLDNGKNLSCLCVTLKNHLLSMESESTTKRPCATVSECTLV